MGVSPALSRADSDTFSSLALARDQLLDAMMSSVAKVALDSTSSIAEIGNIDADLDGNFGGSWHTRTDVLWGIAGCPSNNSAVGIDLEDTLYYTRSTTTTQKRWR
jgi:hypothetical protein